MTSEFLRYLNYYFSFWCLEHNRKFLKYFLLSSKYLCMKILETILIFNGETGVLWGVWVRFGAIMATIVSWMIIYIALSLATAQRWQNYHWMTSYRKKNNIHVRHVSCRKQNHVTCIKRTKHLCIHKHQTKHGNQRNFWEFLFLWNTVFIN